MNLKDQLHKELAESQAKVDALEEFPDLELKKDRWGRERLHSQSLNKKATKFELQNECDCCDKVPVYLLPYEEYKGIRIYADCELPIAKRWTNGRIVENDDWEDQFYDSGCSRKLFAAIEAWLQPYIDNDEEDEDDDF